MAGHQGKLKISWHHADHHVRLAIKQNLLSQHMLVAMEPALPRAVAQHHHLLVLIVLLLGVEASEERRHRECLKNPGAHPGSIHSRRIAHPGKLKSRSLVAAQTGKAVCVTGVVSNVGDGVARLPIPSDLGSLKNICQNHEAAGVREGQWSK